MVSMNNRNLIQVAFQDEIEDLLKAGAEDFMRKPFNIAELIDKIAAVIQL